MQSTTIKILFQHMSKARVCPTMLQQLRYVIIICTTTLYDCEPYKGSTTSIYRAHSNFNQRIDLPFCISPPVSKVISASRYNSANKPCERNILYFISQIYKVLLIALFREYILHIISLSYGETAKHVIMHTLIFNV